MLLERGQHSLEMGLQRGTGRRWQQDLADGIDGCTMKGRFMACARPNNAVSTSKLLTWM
jgi:hypothetical protein